jgi:hypothetical protein
MIKRKPKPSLEEALQLLTETAWRVSQKGKGPSVVKRILKLEKKLRRYLQGGKSIRRSRPVGPYGPAGPVTRKNSKWQKGRTPYRKDES